MWTLLLTKMMMMMMMVTSGRTEAQAGNRLILKNGANNPCNGTLQVYHKDMWYYVSKEFLTEHDQTVACRSTHCGKPEKIVGVTLPPDANLWMKGLNCNGTEDHVWDCGVIQWISNNQEYMHQTIERLTCSENPIVSLEFQCGGRVRYSKGDESGFICGDKFGKVAGDIVCKSLGCGGQKEVVKWPSPGSTSVIFTDCLGTEEHLWHCASSQNQKRSCQDLASVYCEGYREVRLRGDLSNVCSGELEEKIENLWKPVKNDDNSTLQNWCEQMFCGNYRLHKVKEEGTQLTCSDSVRVTLRSKGGTNDCYGTVHLERQGETTPVCATAWTDANSDLVCKELNCGKMLMWRQTPFSSPVSILDNVKCSDVDKSLWHCKSKHSNEPFQCKHNAYVICSGTNNICSGWNICSGSLEVRLSDGPSRCFGRLELKFEGSWQNAKDSGFDAKSQATVCRQLDCGDLISEPSDPPRFNKGPHKFLKQNFKCNDKATNLASCSIEDSTISRDDKIVVITCSNHSDVLFSGGFCDGEVQVQESSMKLLWLSAAPGSWTEAVANAVCSDKRCGPVHPGGFGLRHKNSSELSLWTVKDCGSNVSSVFDCDHEVIAAGNGTERQVAWVNCTGNNTVKLTEGCWGFVTGCDNGECGGVCHESWSTDRSERLCKTLGCGGHALPLDDGKAGFTLRYSSLYLPPNQPLHAALAIRRHDSDTSCSGKAAYAVCTGSYKAQFHQKRDFCSGNVQLLQEDTWQAVCEKRLKNVHASNAICAALKCGSHLKSIPHYGLSRSPLLKFDLTCSMDNFTSCSAVRAADSCSPQGLRCSAWRQMVLQRGENPCSGVLFVYSEEEPAAVSSHGWTQNETNRLCSDLNCGDSGTHSELDTEQKMTVSTDRFWNSSFKCSNVLSPQNIWDCEDHHLPMESKHLKKQLKVNCAAPPVVTLSANCTGRVLIDSAEVCASSWSDSYSNMLCEGCGCGAAVYIENLPPSSPSFQHVSCEPHHSHLSQCQRYSAPCPGKVVSAYCRDSVKLRLSKTCGGDIEVSFEDGQWFKVCSNKDLPSDLQKQLCPATCGNPVVRTDRDKEPPTDLDKTKLRFSLDCNEDDKDVKYCLSKKSCSGELAQLYCEGFVPPPTQPSQSFPWVPTILGVVLLVVLAVGAMVFLRFYLQRKNKTLKQLLPAVWRLKQQDVESAESEDYDEYKDVHRDPPDAHCLQTFGGAADKGSYDNVDELMRPLTFDDPQCPPTGDSDGGDSYDDIDVSPGDPGDPGDPGGSGGPGGQELQTTAEVHAPPLVTEGVEEQRHLSPDAGKVEEGSVDLVLGDDDYLVPPGGET